MSQCNYKIPVSVTLLCKKVDLLYTKIDCAQSCNFLMLVKLVLKLNCCIIPTMTFYHKITTIAFNTTLFVPCCILYTGTAYDSHMPTIGMPRVSTLDDQIRPILLRSTSEMYIPIHKVAIGKT